MKIVFNVVLLNVLIFSLLGCNTTEPDNDKNVQLSLSVEDVSSTEAWLKFSTSGITLSSTVNIMSDNVTLAQISNPANKDTIIFIDSLLPNTSYSFQAVLQSNQKIKSENIAIATLDTSSRDFTWQTFAFGEHSSSAIYDVAVIDENNIWAVGEIYLQDSTGKADPILYNLAKWDGNQWSLWRLPYKYQGQIFFNPIKSIFGSLLNNIWFCGNGLVQWDGNKFNEISIPPLVWGSNQMNKIWGNLNEFLYIVGDNGNIARYNGKLWQKIESGTETNINDIWGVHDNTTQTSTVLCAVSNRLSAGDYKILSIKENKVDSLSWNTDRRVQSVWFEDNLKIFACGGGIFINNGDGNWHEQEEVPLISTNRIRGNGKNDVFVGGDFGLLAHYNGVNWKVFPEANVALFYSLDYKNNIVVAVGERNARAVILMGKR